MKKLLVIALCIIMCIAMFAGCGNTASPTPDATEAPENVQAQNGMWVVESLILKSGDKEMEQKLIKVEGNKISDPNGEWEYDYGDGIVQTLSSGTGVTTITLTYDKDAGTVTEKAEYKVPAYANMTIKTTRVYRYTFDSNDRIIKLVIDSESETIMGDESSISNIEKIYDYTYYENNYTITMVSNILYEEKYVFIVPYDDGEITIEYSGNRISDFTQGDEDVKEIIKNAVMHSRTFTQKGYFISEYCIDAEENKTYEADYTDFYDKSANAEISIVYNDNNNIISSTHFSADNRTEYILSDFDENGNPASLTGTMTSASGEQLGSDNFTLKWVKIPDYMVDGLNRLDCSIMDPIAFLDGSRETLFDEYAWIFKSYKKTDIFVPVS